ncbi:cystatin-like [Pseudorasbora parva]|uniref:cystatin-like n=1 Tax=Pseudorasbora parva TaxID=51549 RepID=UPI00351E054B
MYLTMIVPFLAAILAAASAGPVGGLVGGIVDGGMDKDARSALEFAMAQYNSQSNDENVYRVSKVIKVQKQVVAGMKYIFTVNVAKTKCKKGGETLCTIQLAPAKVIRCKITVWTQSWLNSIEVIEHICM